MPIVMERQPSVKATYGSWIMGVRKARSINHKEQSLSRPWKCSQSRSIRHYLGNKEIKQSTYLCRRS
uniref:Uncharacterized protein n=2 Tax=Picea TaxID=3328 RepID=A0A101LU30_PICGL|nr:hypothetical protein ABT39_MTgene3437 [Picea glauca]QHR92710.1 hypothetical protein Q903MT_gene6758 [Picea sitchensis]